MSGGVQAAQGFPLTLSLSKGERKAFFNGLLGGRYTSPFIETRFDDYFTLHHLTHMSDGRQRPG